MTFSSMVVLISREDFYGSNLTPDQMAIKNFEVRGTEYYLVSDASQALQNYADSLMMAGKTAGVVAESLLDPDAIFFDMDATVIAEESLVEIAKLAGKGEDIERITMEAMAGGMDFATSLRLRLSILKGVNRELVSRVSHSLNPGMKELSLYCQRTNIPMYLVSGGFTDLAEGVARELGFSGVVANRFLWNGEMLAGDVEPPLIDAAGKLQAVQEWCKRESYRPERCWAVGDGANDLAMMEFCGGAVGFAPKKALWAHLDLVNAIGDHRLLLQLLSA